MSYAVREPFSKIARKEEARKLLEELCYLHFRYGPDVIYVNLGRDGTLCTANDVQEAVLRVVQLAAPELRHQDDELDELRAAVRTRYRLWRQLQNKRRAMADRENEELALADQMEEER